LEVLRLTNSVDGIRAQADIIDAGVSPFAVSYDWVLDTAWRTRAVHIRFRGKEHRKISIERIAETNWRVDGCDRHDLSGCEEIDMSVTPFCNTLALLRFGPPPGAEGELTTLYVGVPQLSLRPSRQRYERIGPREFMYVDLGIYSGFRARLNVDANAIVQSYENLYERIDEE
jgi:hypothetical protein